MSSTDTTAPEPATPPAPRVSKTRSRVVALLMALAGLLGVSFVLYAWRLPPFSSPVQSTENAYVRGQVTVISPQVSGYVVETPVQDFQAVQAGQLLARIDGRIYQQRVEQAQAAVAAQQGNLANALQQRRTAEAGVGQVDARIASARAALVRAQADERRATTLRRQGWLAQAALDTTQAARRQAEAAVQEATAARTAAQQGVTSAVVGRETLAANVQAAQAALHLAEIDLANTRIVAPRNGTLGEVGVRQGQYVTAGTQLMSLVPDRVWVVANFKETQLARMRVGQPAVVRVDALAHARLSGRVERISPATGAEFSVIRPDNATGNFTKVAQRIPVRILLDANQPLIARLRPGMSVEARVDTSQ
jgi:multidrug resistance efflux pump